MGEIEKKPTQIHPQPLTLEVLQQRKELFEERIETIAGVVAAFTPTTPREQDVLGVIEERTLPTLRQQETVLEGQITVFENELCHDDTFKKEENLMLRIAGIYKNERKSDYPTFTYDSYSKIVFTYNRKVREALQQDTTEVMVEQIPQILEESPTALIPVSPKPAKTHPSKEVEKKVGVDFATLSDHALDTLVRIFEGRRDLIDKNLRSFTQTVGDFQAGKATVPTPVDFLKAGTVETKLAYAVRTLQGSIAMLIIPEGVIKEDEPGLEKKLAETINDLIYRLDESNSPGDQKRKNYQMVQGVQRVKEALNALSAVERVLLYEHLSTSIKMMLDFPDLEECDEEQFGDYIVRFSLNVPWGARENIGIHELRRNRLMELIEVSLDRAIDEQFNLHSVLETILQDERSEKILTIIFNSAREEIALEQAEAFFSWHKDTHYLADLCSKLLRGE